MKYSKGLLCQSLYVLRDECLNFKKILLDDRIPYYKWLFNCNSCIYFFVQLIFKVFYQIIYIFVKRYLKIRSDSFADLENLLYFFVISSQTGTFIKVILYSCLYSYNFFRYISSKQLICYNLDW